MKYFKNRAPGFLSSPTESLAPTEGCIWWWERVRESTCAPVPFPVPCCGWVSQGHSGLPVGAGPQTGCLSAGGATGIVSDGGAACSFRVSVRPSCRSRPSSHHVTLTRAPCPRLPVTCLQGTIPPCVTWADPPCPIRLPSQGPICVLSFLPLKSQERQTT